MVAHINVVDCKFSVLVMKCETEHLIYHFIKTYSLLQRNKGVPTKNVSLSGDPPPPPL